MSNPLMKLTIGPDTTPKELFLAVTGMMGPMLQGASDQRVQALAIALVESACATMAVLELPPGESAAFLKPELERCAAVIDDINQEEKKARS